MTLTLEQSQKKNIVTVYDVKDDGSFEPTAIYVSNNDIDELSINLDQDTQHLGYGLPNDPNFNWAACAYSGLDVVDLDEQDDD